jgi:hypothetical protein
MRYLTSGLVAEGRTDDRFLPPLLSRALEELCADEFDESVEVSEVQVLRSRGGPLGVDGIVELVDGQRDSFVLVFVHRDQGANVDRVRSEWTEPLRTRWDDRAGRLVMVVPVRETEAWMLADGDALRAVLRVRWPDSQLGVPAPPRRVEEIADPKQVLHRLEARISRSFDAYLDRLGEEMSIEALRKVPAFWQWWEDTRSALAEVGFRRRRG